MSKALNAPTLLMPKATAVWLVDNTALTFEQIGDFTNLHAIEVQALADEEVGRGIVGRNPIEHGELAQAELDKAAEDTQYRMKASRSELPAVKQRAKGPKYTPVSKRGDKPNGIAWILKHHPEISDAQIVKLIGTTKGTIQNIRDRSHANMANIRPENPVDRGLCTYTELDAAITKGLKAQGKDPEAVKAERQAQKNQEMEQDQDQGLEEQSESAFDFSNFLTSGN